MSTTHKRYSFTISILLTLALLAAIWAISQLAEPLFGLLEHSPEPELVTVFFMISVLFLLSFTVFYLSEQVQLPSFVMAIFVGMAARPLLEPIDHQHTVLSALVGLGATLMLFGGGLETPFKNFKKLIVKIVLLSFVGLLLTAVLFSQTIVWLNDLFHLNISVAMAVLLGAVLASTDPAAIIPILKRLRFKNRLVKDMIISESAVTDVSGTMLTVVFLALISAGTVFTSLAQGYQLIVSADSALNIATQLGLGVLFGVIGYGILELVQRWKKSHEREYEADSAFFLFIPVILFTFAITFGGSGYLAAFIAGLLFNLQEHLHDTEKFFNHLIDAFFKPIIFILLGSLVDPGSLLEYAGIGIVAGLAFMLIIRPLAVFSTLGIFTWFGKDRFSLRELLFISCVRETGAIPAVLLVTIISLGLPDVTGLLPIGMWVILLTLVIEPILTPWFAKRLAVAETMSDAEPLELVVAPSVLLVSRGRTFVERLPKAIDWAMQHHIPNVTVLLCLEDRYTSALEEAIAAEANTLFEQSPSELTYKFISRQGLLQDNIEALTGSNQSIAAVFVGRKMLDYRLPDVKRLQVPLVFID